jgi:hypothetical protein
VPGQRAGEIHDVLRLPTRVGVATELQVIPPNQAVDADKTQ